MALIVFLVCKPTTKWDSLRLTEVCSLQNKSWTGIVFDSHVSIWRSDYELLWHTSLSKPFLVSVANSTLYFGFSLNKMTLDFLCSNLWLLSRFATGSGCTWECFKSQALKWTKTGNDVIAMLSMHLYCQRYTWLCTLYWLFYKYSLLDKYTSDD